MAATTAVISDGSSGEISLAILFPADAA